MMDILNKMST